MLDIEVLRPTKTDSIYAFECHLRPRRAVLDRLRRSRQAAASLEPSELHFGFRAHNFTIRHHEVWDSFYPLYFLTRNGGPLFGKDFDRARIRFRYPISPLVRDFFIRRAADMGVSIIVEAETHDVRLDQDTDGDVVAFGGGKDSRLILGMLREFGTEPTVITAKGAYATDIPDAWVSESIHGALADRIMPSYMALPRRLHFGSTIGEIHLRTPWHQHYDVSARAPSDEMTAFLRSLGVEMEICAPLHVLPYNIIQRILHDRYPGLYAGQMSTRPGSHAEKSLHIALLKLFNGYTWAEQCTEQMFVQMLKKFVRQQTNRPTDFGFRDARQNIQGEMRAIIWRCRDDPHFVSVRDRIPPEWDAAWIDYMQPQLLPALEARYLALFREYAPAFDDAGLDPSSLSARRVPA